MILSTLNAYFESLEEFFGSIARFDSAAIKTLQIPSLEDINTMLLLLDKRIVEGYGIPLEQIASPKEINCLGKLFFLVLLNNAWLTCW